MSVAAQDGMFVVHKGPWPVLVRGEYRSVADVKPEGEGFALFALGSTSMASMLAAREKSAALSDALDRGRAGLLRTNGSPGVSLVSYELTSTDPTLPPDIRVQSVSGFVESTLAELDKSLPAE